MFGAARQMQNLIYLIGDLSTRQCYVVDACWDAKGINAYAKRFKMRLVGAIATHWHFDRNSVDANRRCETVAAKTVVEEPSMRSHHVARAARAAASPRPSSRALHPAPAAQARLPLEGT